ncbi:MAG: hypothetical protein SO532_05790 [Candidatus Borkfalkiaceae bacterium]|nr:hypothetical protein [Christensenellaceae bacterium]
MWNKFSFGTKWNLRDIMRHKSRTLMSLIGIIGCMILMAGALGMNDTMNAFLSDYYDKAMNYSSRIYVTETTSAEETRAIAEKYEGDWSASVSVEMGDGGVSLDVYGVTHDKVRFPDAKGNFVTLGDDGAYICRRIAEEFKLKTGDTFTVSPYGSDKKYEFKVAGIVYSASKNISITPAYADACGVTYKADSIYISAEKDVLLADDLTKNFEIQEKQTIIDSFNSFTELLAMSVTVLIVAGIVLGLPLAAGTLTYLVKELASEYEMRVVMGPATFIVSILTTFGVSLLVSLMVARKNKKIDMVEALKGAE